MSVETRYNDKQKVEQFRVRYRWRDDTGKLKCSKTAWFASLKEAEKNADELKTAKEADSSLKITNKRTAYIYTVMKSLYLPELEQHAHRVTTEQITTDVNRWKMTRTVLKFHTPDEIRYTKINEISPRTFRMWVSHINEKNLSGASVSKYIEMLCNFNRWLADKGYYTDTNLELNIDLAINRTPTKRRSVGARRDRYLLGSDDIAKICRYYREKGLGVFKNFYYYTLFYFMFYSCLRSEEATALQWKAIDLRPDERIIYVRNAITQAEKESNALERTKKGIYYCKNVESERGLPILNVLYDLLVDYKESYKYASGREDIEECFVFPRTLKYDRFDWDMFQGPGYWLLEYKDALKACGLPNSDIGMLRHSGASFLVAPEPDGLNFNYSQIKTYMGHCSEVMLRTIYARLEAKQKTVKMKGTFKDFYSPEENIKDKANLKAKERVIDRVKGKTPQQEEFARKERIIGQITQCIARGQDVYEYTKRDARIIDSVKDKFNIQFVLIK